MRHVYLNLSISIVALGLNGARGKERERSLKKKKTPRRNGTPGRISVVADKPPLLRVFAPLERCLCVSESRSGASNAQPNRAWHLLHTGAVLAQLTIVANHLFPAFVFSARATLRKITAEHSLAGGVLCAGTFSPNMVNDCEHYAHMYGNYGRWVGDWA